MRRAFPFIEGAPPLRHVQVLRALEVVAVRKRPRSAEIEALQPCAVALAEPYVDGVVAARQTRHIQQDITAAQRPAHLCRRVVVEPCYVAVASPVRLVEDKALRLCGGAFAYACV